ncbi:uncharacterized protein LOC134719769 isoform X3 [Mytilus trossulus]|uniref:uncharacterized protein LOC134719769 isoform X3 n=1 Tax=Mytilus trossulus TaxID=6551 RepID=UPI003004B88A
MSFNTKMILISGGRLSFKMKCQKELCEADIPTEATFCTGCGTEVQMIVPVIKTTRCPSCNNIVLEGFKYCCSCGGIIDSALFVDIVCSGTNDNGEKCNTVLTAGTSFCPSCGTSHKSNTSNNFAGDASLKLSLQITHQKECPFDKTKPLIKEECDNSEPNRQNFWKALTIKQEPNDDNTESVKDNVEDQGQKRNKERTSYMNEQEDTVIVICDSESAEDGEHHNNERTEQPSKRKIEEKGGQIKKIKLEKEKNYDNAKTNGIEGKKYGNQESVDPQLENTYMHLTALTDSTKKEQEAPKETAITDSTMKEQEAPKETAQKDTDAEKSELSHSKVRQKPGMGGKGGCNKWEKEGHWLKDYPKGPIYNDRSTAPMRDMYPCDPYPRDPYDAYYRDRYLPPPPMNRFDRYRPYPDPYDRRPLLPPRDPFSYARPPPDYYGALGGTRNPYYDHYHDYYERRTNYMYPLPPPPPPPPLGITRMSPRRSRIPAPY